MAASLGSIGSNSVRLMRLVDLFLIESSKDVPADFMVEIFDSKYLNDEQRKSVLEKIGVMLKNGAASDETFKQKLVDIMKQKKFKHSAAFALGWIDFNAVSADLSAADDLSLLRKADKNFILAEKDASLAPGSKLAPFTDKDQNEHYSET